VPRRGWQGAVTGHRILDNIECIQAVKPAEGEGYSTKRAGPPHQSNPKKARRAAHSAIIAMTPMAIWKSMRRFMDPAFHTKEHLAMRGEPVH